MTDTTKQAELLCTQTDDAVVWAKEFCQLNPSMDEANMIGWFANAIECSHDLRMKKLADLIAPIQEEPVAWVVRIKKTHEFCDPTELYGDTAEEVVEISSAWNSEYSDPIPLYTAPPDTLLDEVLKALRIGLINLEPSYDDDYKHEIESAIAALEKYRWGNK